jgi:hypothetical protein
VHCYAIIFSNVASRMGYPVVRGRVLGPGSLFHLGHLCNIPFNLFAFGSAPGSSSRDGNRKLKLSWRSS